MTGNLKSYLAELMGTFALVFAGAGALSGGRVGPVGAAAAYGSALAAMILAFDGHFNPALTAAQLANKKIDVLHGVFFIAAQLLGAAFAGMLLRACLHSATELSVGACQLSGVGFKAATLLEAVATFFLVLVRAEGAGASGLALAMGSLAIGTLTGGAMNPARFFGPAVVTGHWSNWYVYVVGPCAGALAAAFLRENLYAAPKG